MMTEPPLQETRTQVPPTAFISKYVFSLDHKAIALQYYALSLLAVFVGMVFSWLMRIHVIAPNAAIKGLHLLSANGARGDVRPPEFYLAVMTIHGTLMIFFVLTVAPL